MKEQSLSDFLENELKLLEEANLYRKPRIYPKDLINFSSNDYLGLADKSFTHSTQLGSTGSRLTTGTHEEHLELESLIADWKSTEAAIIFGSGYLANLGTISALLNSRDVVFTDELNHACIFDGIRLSKAKKFIYRHNDMKHLEELLELHRNKYQKSMIVSDTVFSMDGDRADLVSIAQLASNSDSFFYVDEAHATGVFGSQGAGLVQELKDQGLLKPDSVAIQMGTFSKALGVEGAYIAGSKDLIIYLQNHARTFMFSTASSPMMIQAIISNLKLIRTDPSSRNKLHTNIKYFRDLLTEYSIQNWINDHTAIFAILVESINQALNLSESLARAGFLVMPIRPPTVPSPRLRICISAKHSQEELLGLAKALRNILSS